MARARKKIPPEIKRALVKDAGGKCANPGCSAWETHIHHIKPWAVYETHDHADMIAICPTCHAHVHFGAVRIDDDTLRRWKGIQRIDVPDSHIFVEGAPRESLKMVTGSVAFSASRADNALFQLPNQSTLAIRVLDSRYILLSGTAYDACGRQLYKLVENHLRCNIQKVRYEYRPGRIRLTVDIFPELFPDWFLPKVRYHEPWFGESGSITLVGLEVIRPGVVRVEGCWPSEDAVVAITPYSLNICRKSAKACACLMGAGEDALFVPLGPLADGIFKIT